MSPVIVAFHPGTSGRFISAICHMLQNNSTEEIKWGVDNSAHNYNKFNECYLKDTPLYFQQDKDFVNSSLVYRYLDLEPHKIMPTHAYPDFKLIKEKSPNCKIIIIGCEKHNFPEIAFNSVSKNKPQISLESYEKLLNVYTRKFVSIKIPDQYKDNTQVIMYDEIYKPIDNTYIGLERIIKFLDIKSNDIILKNYQAYVAGRNDLLQKHNIAKI